MTMDLPVAETPGMITKADGDPGQAAAAAMAEGYLTEAEVEAEVEVVDIGVTRGEVEAEGMEAGGEYHNFFALRWICIARAFRGNLWMMARALLVTSKPRQMEAK